MGAVRATRRNAVICLIVLTLGSVLATTPAPAASPLPPVVLIVMENHDYGQIVGSAQARYLNRTFIPAGELFTNSWAISHPSLPNYLAMTAGSRLGCATDSCPPGSFRANNLFAQLDRAGIGWRAWEESMPSNCRTSDAGSYVVRHNPPVYFSHLVSRGKCGLWDRPYPSALPPLRPFTFITPNICNDMHSCSIATGDAWLASHVPGLLAAGAVVIITFDEGTSTDNHVMTAVVGPGVGAGTSDHHRYTHYSLLGGLEARFGLPELRKAAAATPLPI